MDNAGNLGSAVSTATFSIAEGVLSVNPPETLRHVELGPATPNPNTGHALVVLNLARGCEIRLCLLDIQGRERALLANGPRPSGRQTLAIHADGLPPGLYFLRLSAAGIVRTSRFVVVR
jgi:hypothetical protein